MKIFLRAVFGGLINPGPALRGAAEADGRIRKAALMVLSIGALYALTSFGLGISGAVPLWPVTGGWEPDNYYFWQMIVILPGAVFAWLFVAALLLGLASRTNRSGGFGKALAVAGPALSGPLFVAWLPSAVQAALMAMGMGQEEWVGLLSDPGPGQTLYLVCYGLAALTALRLFISGSGILRNKARGVGAGCLAAAAVMVAFLAFVR